MKLPTPDDLDNGPELAILAVLETALRTASTVLISIHPELRSGMGLDDSLPSAPVVWIAENLIQQADLLELLVDRYRAALRVPLSFCTDNSPNF